MVLQLKVAMGHCWPTNPFREEFGLFYVDCHESTVNTSPELVMRKLSVTLTLTRGSNGIEWLSYITPAHPEAVAMCGVPSWSEQEATILNLFANAEHEVACPSIGFSRSRNGTTQHSSLVFSNGCS